MEQNRECIYREPGIKLDAGDKLILAQLDRIERMLEGQAPTEDPNLGVDPSLTDQSTTAAGDGFNTGGGNDGLDRPNSPPNEGFDMPGDSESATVKLHMTPALHLLQWPKIGNLVSRTYNLELLLQPEMAREPLQLGDSLSLEFAHNDECVSSFFHDANIWYACVDPATWGQTYYTASAGHFREGPESCLVLLVLALGNASHSGNTTPMPQDTEPPGMPYFTAAWSQLPNLMINHNIISSQCVILASAYLLYLVRPIEAWTLLNSTLMKLKLLLNTSSGIAENLVEISTRVIWNAILLEGEILAELDLPQSPIANYSSMLGLPGNFPVGQDETSAEIFPDQSWYLQASIGLRRLTTRINQTIYSASAPTSTTVLEPLVNSLDADLLAWYSDLPFGADSLPTTTSQPLSHPAQTLLRFRYHSTRALIFRPYILAAFSNPTATSSPPVRAACYACLDSCVRALEHVALFRSRFVPCLWQGALATVGLALLVLGAKDEPGLVVLLPAPLAQVDLLLKEVVGEIERLGDKAPSLGLAGETLAEAVEKLRGGGEY